MFLIEVMRNVLAFWQKILLIVLMLTIFHELKKNQKFRRIYDSPKQPLIDRFND